MVFSFNNEDYNIYIEKKIRTKNIYLRVKEDLNIYVTCHTFTTNKEIVNLIENNKDKIIKMIERRKKSKEKEESFYYLGKKYDLVYINSPGITFGEDKVFVNSDFNLNKWYLKMASNIFKEEFDKMYDAFIYDIPYPSLTIRKMKTRWGVCNTKACKVTLNLELIKKNPLYLDYVIVHELSHLLHPNHSKAFWQCVEDNFKDYKKIRKELRKDE